MIESGDKMKFKLLLTNKNCNKKKDFIFFIICTSIVYIFLLFFRVNNRTLFVDEATTALLGENVRKYLIPRVWDGVNLVTSSVNGNEFNESLVYIKHNWLPYYWAAFCQLFGSGITEMRVGFAFIGLIGYVGYIFLVKEILPNKVREQKFAIILYTLSVPILLINRTIYYCAPALTFTILCVLFFFRSIRSKKRNWIWYCLSSIMLFHSLYLFFFITITSQVITYLIYYIDKKRNKYFILVLFISGIFCVPWYIYNAMYLSKVTITAFVGIPYFFKLLFGYLWMIQAYFFPFIILLPPYIFLKLKDKGAFKRKKEKNPDGIYARYRKKYKSIKVIKDKNFFMIIQIFLNLIIISVFAVWLNTRWLIASIPFFYIIIAKIIGLFYMKTKNFSLAVLVIVSFTNVLHIIPYSIVKTLYEAYPQIENVVVPPVPYFNTEEKWKTKKYNLKEYLDNYYYRSYFLDFCRELSNDYMGADKGMIDFLNKNAKKGDRVYVLGYQQEIIIYYTDLEVVNRLTPNLNLFSLTYHSYPNAEKYEYLTSYPIEHCDWIVERIPTGNEEVWHDGSSFDAYFINYSDWDEWNEIWAHTFYKDNNTDGFYIYKNKK